MRAEKNFVKDIDMLRKTLKNDTFSDPFYRSLCKRAMGNLDHIELIRKRIIDPKEYKQAVNLLIYDLEILYMQ